MKILYMMHVEWGWIKQRPHFIAEGLSKNNTVQVFYETSFNKFIRSANPTTIPKRRLFNIPFRGRFKIVSFLDVLINKIIVSIYNKMYKYDVVWLCHPSHVKYVKHLKIPIVYDCMDNHVEFELRPKLGESISDYERYLFLNARHVFFSSEKLQSINVGSVNIKHSVLLNGISSNLLVTTEEMEFNVRRDGIIKNIMYFGTVASWFDFNAVSLLLSVCPLVRFTIIGPIEDGLSVYRHERLKYTGPVEHEKLIDACKDADAFIMPFIVSDLILSVDPVKLYEYIAFGKPIISVNYPGLARFSNFINPYNSDIELEEIGERINSGKIKTYDEISRQSFLQSSTWDMRCEAVNIILNNCEDYDPI
jgi:teichuronic acid biosynthesis glycosyltransferase TuaH